MDIVTKAACQIDAPIDDVFKLFLRMDITKVMTGFGPFPAIERVEGIDGTWDTSGATRRVYLADSTSAHEELTLVEAPRRFTYLVTDNTGPLGKMVRAIHGDFRFSQKAGGTRVDWSQTFDTRLPFVGILFPVLKLGWARYLNAALVEAKSIAETNGEST